MYVATINVPGYLPMDDDPPVFESIREAWLYLAEQRSWALADEDHTDDGSLDDIVKMVDVGTVYGSTPGYDGDHDLGLAYCVTWREEDGS